MSDLKIEGSSLDTDRDLFSDKVLFLRGFIGKATKWLVCTMNPWVESDVNLMSDKKTIHTQRERRNAFKGNATYFTNSFPIATAAQILTPLIV